MYGTPEDKYGMLHPLMFCLSDAHFHEQQNNTGSHRLLYYHITYLLLPTTVTSSWWAGVPLQRQSTGGHASIYYSMTGGMGRPWSSELCLTMALSQYPIKGIPLTLGVSRLLPVAPHCLDPCSALNHQQSHDKKEKKDQDWIHFKVG